MNSKNFRRISLLLFHFFVVGRIHMQGVLCSALTALLKKSAKSSRIGGLSCLLVGASLLVSFSTPQDCALSESERVELESFFKLLFKRSEFGYTLFGQKPLSFYSYCIKPPPGFLLFTSFTEPKIEKFYQICDKYRERFSAENYIFLDQLCISNKFPTSGFVRDILIINKQAFAKVVDTYLPLFQERLGRAIDADYLFEEIASGKNVLFEVLKEDELLWGLLLGYGRHNAEIYARREALKEVKVVFPQQVDLRLKEELEAINDLLVGFTHEYYVDLIALPMFMCDEDHPETKALKSSYKQVRSTLHKIYTSPDFLDLVLQQLGFSTSSPKA